MAEDAFIQTHSTKKGMKEMIRPFEVKRETRIILALFSFSAQLSLLSRLITVCDSITLISSLIISVSIKCHFRAESSTFLLLTDIFAKVLLPLLHDGDFSLAENEDREQILRCFRMQFFHFIRVSGHHLFAFVLQRALENGEKQDEQRTAEEVR